MNKKEALSNSLDWYSVANGKKWFDEIGRRIVINTLDRPIKIGYGHNKRMIELEVIAYSEEPERDPELEVLEGEIVEEDA